MENSIAAGRRLALRVVCAQIGATVLVAGGFLLAGWRSGVAALCGGTVVAVATGVLALRIFGAGPAPAGMVFARLVVGNLLKWGVIAIGLYLAMAKAGLPGLPVMCGVIAALIPQLLGLHPGWSSDRSGAQSRRY
ncbi:MAG TPA: ATP synthase subunit I [Rudaea sp.]|jgi:ATP synthase protein I